MKNHDLISMMACEGKVAFETYAQAESVNQRSKRKPNSLRRGAYHCPICRMYHIGKRAPATKAKRLITKRKKELEGEE